MTSFILWFSGCLTTLSLGFGIYYFLQNKKNSSSLKLAIQTLNSTQQELNERKSSKRLAKLTTKGWNFTDNKDKNFPKGWEVYYELKEIAVSQDETKTKFEVTSIVSENRADPWIINDQKQNYIDWFNSHYEGGWLKNDNPNLEWITTVSKSEARDMKLKELGID